MPKIPSVKPASRERGLNHHEFSTGFLGKGGVIQATSPVSGTRTDLFVRLTPSSNYCCEGIQLAAEQQLS